GRILDAGGRRAVELARRTMDSAPYRVAPIDDRAVPGLAAVGALVGDRGLFEWRARADFEAERALVKHALAVDSERHLATGGADRDIHAEDRPRRDGAAHHHDVRARPFAA